MALVKGTNSYVTVAEADSYFAERLHSETWSGASPTDKEKALITATGLLDQKPWVGEAEDELQPLAFPRIGYYYDPKYGRDLDLIDTPERVRDDSFVIREWKLRYYDKDNRAFVNGAKSDDCETSMVFDYIVPVKDFDFENLESNKEKSIC